jgi:NADH-quinone oxidoreductase subunit N
MELLADLNTASPEAILAGFGLFGVLLGAILGDRSSTLIRYLSALALAAAAAVAFMQFTWPPRLAFNSLYQVTPFIAFSKGATYALAAVTLVMSGGAMNAMKIQRYDPTFWRLSSATACDPRKPG